MQKISYRFLSLTLTAIFSFVLPLLLLSGVALGLLGIQALALLHPIGQEGLRHFLHFLTTLGSGNPWHGMVVVGVTSSTVGVLFDTFVPSRVQGLGHH